MFKPSRTLNLVLASSVALSMIVLAYLFSGPFTLSPSLAEAQSADELLKAYASKDSDSDGLPDWQESLYGTDPENPQSVKAGVSDSDAVAQGLVSLKFASDTSGLATTAGTDVPGTAVSDSSLTAQFSQAFFKAYVAAGGQNMTESDQQALLNTLMADFSARAQKLVVSSYTSVNVHTDPAVTVTDYAGAVESALVRYDVPAGEGSAVELMDAFVNGGDQSAQPKLLRLAASYASISKALANAHVPPALLSQHLALMQSFDTLGRATALVADYQKDPIGVLGALSVYVPASKSASDAFKSIGAAIVASGEPAEGAPGYLLVSIARYAQ